MNWASVNSHFGGEIIARCITDVKTAWRSHDKENLEVIDRKK